MAVSIGVISIKGGVGKTTLSAALASDLANNHGKKVLLVDANYSAPNLGLHMDIVEPDKTIHDVLEGNVRIDSAIANKFGVDVISGDYTYSKPLNFFKLKDRIGKIKQNYDFVVIDSSPSLNNELLSAILASDKLFVVSTPDYPTLSCSLRAAHLAKHRGRPVEGIIINKIRDPGYELSLDDIEEATGIPVVARIRDDKSAVRSLFIRTPVPIYNKGSEISREIHKLSSALVGSAEKRSWLSFIFGEGYNKEEVNRQVLKDSFYKSAFSKKK